MFHGWHLAPSDYSKSGGDDRRASVEFGRILGQLFCVLLWWLYLTHGVIGGTGLGDGLYSTSSRPGEVVPGTQRADHRYCRRRVWSWVSPMAAPIAVRLIERVGPLTTFAYLGIAYAIVSLTAASFMRNPPPGWQPEAWKPTDLQVSQRSDRDYTVREAVTKWQWWAICALLAINTMAGLSLLLQDGPDLSGKWGRLPPLAAKAGFVGIISIGNGLGRIFWAWISDLATRKIAFFLMFLVAADSLLGVSLAFLLSMRLSSSPSYW